MSAPQSLTSRPPRFAVRLSAEIRIEGKSITARTRNLSAGGVCLETDRPISEGSFLRIRLFLVEDEIESEGPSVLDLTATVQWTTEADHGYACGLKFSSLTALQSASLTSALRAVGEED